MSVTQIKKKPRLSKEVFDKICDGLMAGKSLKGMCRASNMPSYMTVYRHIREDEDAYAQYDCARQIQCENLREEILALVEAPLPDDPKLAMAEVQRRRLEADQKDKFIRQLAPLGIRGKAEDNKGQAGNFVFSWAGAEIEAG